MYDHLNIISDKFAFIPDEAFLYQPTSNNPDVEKQELSTLQTDDFFIKGKDNQIKRLIYEGNTKYTMFQNKKLQQFEQYLKKKSITLDYRWTRPWKLRWLQSTNYNHKKTVQDMIAYIQYLNRYQEMGLSQKIEKFLKSGIYYLAGRDSKYRPILVLDVKKMVHSKLTEQQIHQCQVYFFEFILKNILIPGQVEMWITLIDVGFEGVLSMIGQMKKSISFLQSTFRNRMHVAYVLRPSTACSIIWSIAQKILQQDTKRKVVFVEGETITDLLQYCHPSQLQKKFGGLLELQENNLWPPRVFSSNFESKIEKKMFTLHQYRQKFKNNLLNNTKVYQPFIKEPNFENTEQKKQIAKEEMIKVEQAQSVETKFSIDKIEQKEFVRKLIEVDFQVVQCLEKLREQNTKYLNELNLLVLNLKPDSGFSWLAGS